MHCPSRRFVASVLVATLTIPAAAAQDRPPQPALDLSALLVPIHGHPDDPSFGPYGLWAAGPEYKVSFHDGFTFYPLLGVDYPENLPLRWTTVAARVGGHALLAEGEKPARVATAWRCEYRYQALTEAYDVRRDGVEQTFVLDQRPQHEGDWVVTGRIDTRLLPLAAPEGKGGLWFGDAAGRALVCYGEAFAVDARGDRVPVSSVFRDGRIELRVDGGWLTRAAFPVVLDPLTLPVRVTNSITGAHKDLHLGHDGTNSIADNVVVAFARYSSATDLDAYAVMTGAAFASAPVIFSDISASLVSEHPRVAFVGGSAQRWAIVFQRSPTSNTVSQVRMWGHDRGNTSMAGGSLAFLGLTAPGTTDRYPDVGGQLGILPVGARALVVYQTDVTANNANTDHTEVRGVLADLGAMTFGTPFLLANTAVGTSLDRERPAVTQVPMHPSLVGSWVAVWQELDRSVANDFWDIYGQRVTFTGARGAQGRITPNSLFQSHRVAPAVAGVQGRYMVAYRTAPNAQSLVGSTLQAIRFDAPESASTITPMQLRTLVPPVSGSTILSHQISHDRITHSHWAITYCKTDLPHTAGILRVGPSGAILESAVLDTTSAFDQSPAVTWLPADPGLPSPGFLAVYATQHLTLIHPIFGRTLRYDVLARNLIYGTGCGGTIGANDPFAGHDFFRVSVSGVVPAATTAILLLSVGSAALDLSGAGMPGCWFNVDPGYFLAFPAASTGGTAIVGLDLPDDPVFLGTLFFQWLYSSPGANAAGLLATRGMQTQVR